MILENTEQILNVALKPLLGITSPLHCQSPASFLLVQSPGGMLSALLDHLSPPPDLSLDATLSRKPSLPPPTMLAPTVDLFSLAFLPVAVIMSHVPMCWVLFLALESQASRDRSLLSAHLVVLTPSP